MRCASKKRRVIVGMSGGVDSSVSAYLLKEAGYEVVGLFMKNWQEEGQSCSAEADFQDVVAVAEQIGIPYYSVNFSAEYRERVFARFLSDLKKGLTPNPDVFCNQEIKFKTFFEKATELEADFIATGHYAQIVQKGGETYLCRASDPEKDQSYFLHRIQAGALAKTLFPIGAMNKKEVRALACSLKLATALKRDSTGICFIGKRNFPDFLSRYFEKRMGPIMTCEGKVVGEHEGLFNYTIGQRKGLRIGGLSEMGSRGHFEPWFVAEKDLLKNILYVVQGENHPRLYSQSLTASEESWISERPSFPLRCTAKIRYRAPDVECRVTELPSGLRIEFEKPVKAAAPGQSIVFYDGPLCLGGAIID